jgi:hypothetical protein
MFDIGINGIPMQETFEDRMGDIKWCVMTKEEGDEHIRSLMVAKFTHVNKVLNTTYGEDELMELPIDKIREIHIAYNNALDAAKAEAEAMIKLQARRKAIENLKEQQRIRKVNKMHEDRSREMKARAKANKK